MSTQTNTDLKPLASAQPVDSSSSASKDNSVVIVNQIHYAQDVDLINWLMELQR